MLDTNGLVDTNHLRALDFATRELLPAGQVDEVISSGRPGEVFEPRHTTHGFRYVQVDGVPDGLDLSGARGILVREDLPRTGEFACSDTSLEDLHEVVRRSLVTNACAVPTDTGAQFLTSMTTARSGRDELALHQVLGPLGLGASPKVVLRVFSRGVPRSPSALISRSTVHRATLTPSRFSTAWIFLAP